MVTAVGTEHELLKALNNLIALNFDAIDAYQAALNRLENASDKAQLHQCMGDHERHTRELGDIVRELGGTPTMQGDIKSVLTQGKVVLGNLMGDSGILKAMKTNEDGTNTASEQAVSRDDLTPHLQEVLQRNLADERHRRA